MVLKARIQNGQLIAQAPPGYPEGTELEIELVDDFEDGMSEEEINELNRRLEVSRRQMEAGQYVPAEQVIAKLRARLK
jgi:hypothetical protein